MLTICVLEASTLGTLRMSAFASASENVSALIDVAGIATRQPNQMLLSAAPARMVPRLDPVGRCEIEGTDGFCWAKQTRVPIANVTTAARSVFFVTA